MPTAFAAGQFRRPLALLAAWLVVLQALLAGIAVGQAGAFAAADPIDVAAICHGAGEAAFPGGTDAPDSGKARHLCCDYCTSSATALPPPAAGHAIQLKRRPVGRVLPPSAFIIVLAPGAVRAGPSQAPPVGT